MKMNALVLGLIFAVAGLSLGTYRETLNLDDRIDNIPEPKIVTTIQVPPVEPEQRIVNLPEDGKAYHTVLYMPANWQANTQARELRSWFDANPQLASLKAQTHFNVITKADPMWQARYAQAVTEVPCVTLVEADGTVVYKASGVNLPKTAKSLTLAVQQGIQKRCPNGKCPWNDEKPPAVIPDTPPSIPDTTPPKVDPPIEEDKELPLWLALLLGVAGAGAAVVPDMVKKFKSLSGVGS